MLNLGTDPYLRPRVGGGGGGRRWFWGGVQFFTGKKHEGRSNFMTQQQQSREFDVSDLSSIPWLGKGKNEIFDAISGPEGRVV